MSTEWAETYMVAAHSASRTAWHIRNRIVSGFHICSARQAANTMVTNQLTVAPHPACAMLLMPGRCSPPTRRRARSLSPRQRTCVGSANVIRIERFETKHFEKTAALAWGIRQLRAARHPNRCYFADRLVPGLFGGHLGTTLVACENESAHRELDA
jgi:hypothetical protein